MDLKRNAAALSAAALVAALGIGGMMSAHADPSPAKSPVGQTGAGSDGETNDDATDTGPDANPNEPGHQDASDVVSDEKADGEKADDEKADGEKADDSGQEAEGSEADEVNEAPGTETNDDATDVGPDADPNEPGHQDAGE